MCIAICTELLYAAWTLYFAGFPTSNCWLADRLDTEVGEDSLAEVSLAVTDAFSGSLQPSSVRRTPELSVWPRIAHDTKDGMRVACPAIRIAGLTIRMAHTFDLELKINFA
jgi:hypothetical protein